MLNSNPMLAAKVTNLLKLRFPVGATPKIDGIRCLITPDGPRTRSLKPIPNHYISRVIALLPLGCDGELTVGSTFQETTSAVMSQDGTPDFTYWLFDNYLAPGGYSERVGYLLTSTYPRYVKLLTPAICFSLDELSAYYSRALADGHEGVCFRLLDSPYKHGRSTLNEQYLCKWKQRQDAEATVLDFVPLFRNHNHGFINELGRLDRSSSQVGLVADNALGALVVSSSEWPSTFELGTGFSTAQRIDIWNNRELIRGQIARFSYHNYNLKDRPREPVFIGFRHQYDV